jgi:exopolyphosphatase / guanosine-5'-triphosphate,3'-diphosphate pyrophosphatase
MRIAAIDVGTNTAQLLVAEVVGGDGPGGGTPGDGERPRMKRIHVAERFVRLGEGVDATGRIGDPALRRLRDALRDHRAAAEALGAEQFVVCATSASRDATNRDAVIRFVRDETDLPYEILPGEEEATWSFAAACAPFGDLHDATLVVDVGGGSTELIAGTDPSGHAPRAEHAITSRVSLDIGCIRLTERYFSAQPPASGDIEAAQEAIDSALDHAPLPPSTEGEAAPAIIGTAGTATALALVNDGPDSAIDPLHGEPRTLSADRVRHWRTETLRRSVDEILSLHPAAMKHRAPVFAAGVMILDTVLRRTGADHLRVSPYELRHGLLLRALSH